EIRRAQKRNRQSHKRRNRDFRRAGYEIQLAPQVSNAARGHINHQTVVKNYSGIERLADHLHLGRFRVLQFVEIAQPVVIKRLQPTEEQLAACFVNQLQVFVAAVEVVGYQRAPLTIVACQAHLVDQVYARVEVTSIAAIKIVVKEKHATAFSRSED